MTVSCGRPVLPWVFAYGFRPYGFRPTAAPVLWASATIDKVKAGRASAATIYRGSCRKRLLPRDVFISVEQRTPGNLDPDEWAILRRVIDLIQANAKG